MINSPRARFSLSRRLLVGSLLWVLCSLVATALLLTQLFKQHIEQQLYKELNVHMLQLISQIEQDQTEPVRIATTLSDPRFEQPLSGLYWLIQSEDQAQTLAYSRSLWDESLSALPTVSEMETRLQVHDPLLGELYVVGRQVTFVDGAVETHYVVWIAAQSEVVLEPLQRFTQMLIVSLMLLGSVLVLGIAWQLKLGLKPLHQLRVQLALVHEGKTETLAGQYPQEIQPLVSEFNRVLQSNAEVIQRARTQAGNLAHAIKTPLAVLANAAKQPPDNLAQLVQQQVLTAQQQVDYHLSRARVAAAVKTVGRRTLVEPAVLTLLQVLKQAYSSKPLHIQPQFEQPELYFKGEAQDLHEMLGNVLDNAFKWAKTQVRVQARCLDPAEGRLGLEVIIEDDGPGLSAEQYVVVFKRGVRADEIAPGSGLGLAIVADLVQLYGGQVNATRSDLGGLRVTLWLP